MNKNTKLTQEMFKKLNHIQIWTSFSVPEEAYSNYDLATNILNEHYYGTENAKNDYCKNYDKLFERQVEPESEIGIG